VILQNNLLRSEFEGFLDAYEPFINFDATRDFPLDLFPYQCAFFLQIDKGLEAVNEEHVNQTPEWLHPDFKKYIEQHIVSHCVPFTIHLDWNDQLMF